MLMNNINHRPPKFWNKAKVYLRKKDKRLGKIIESYPKDFLFVITKLITTFVCPEISSINALAFVCETLVMPSQNLRALLLAAVLSAVINPVAISAELIEYPKS